MNIRAIGLLAALTGVGACGAAECLALPCPAPFAGPVTIRSRATGQPIDTANVIFADGQTVPCAGTCYLPLTVGTFHIQVSAKGYATLDTTFSVTGRTPKCGCPSLDPLGLDLRLSPAT